MADLLLRPYRGMADARALHELRVRCATFDGSDLVSTLDRLPSAEEFHGLASSSGGSDWQLAQDADQVVGYACVGRSWTERDGVAVHLHEGHVDPEWRNRGVATAGLRWAEARIADRYRVSPDGTRKAFYGATAAADDPIRTQFLLAEAYRPVLSMVEMELTDLSRVGPVVVPPGVELSSARPDDVRAVWNMNESAYADRPFIPAPSEFYGEQFITMTGENLSLWILARIRGRLAGFAISRSAGLWAEITEVTVGPEHRRAGLATILINTNLSILRERGHRMVRLHTNGGNISGARSLYTKIGFRVIRTHVRYRKLLPVSTDGS